jgi:hypothetical protein
MLTSLSFFLIGFSREISLPAVWFLIESWRPKASSFGCVVSLVFFYYDYFYPPPTGIS